MKKLFGFDFKITKNGRFGEDAITKSKFFIVDKDEELITDIFNSLKELEEHISIYNISKNDFYIEEEKTAVIY